MMAEQEIEGGQAYGENLVKDSVKGVLPALSFLYSALVGREPTRTTPMYKYWAEFQDYGAITDWPYTKNADQLRKDVETLTNMQDASGLRKGAVKAKDGLAAVLNCVNNTNMAFENATRFAVFMAARKAGMDAEKAAYLAKELTINFNRSSSGGSVINAIYLFFNAGVQGTAKFVRTMGTLKKVPDGRGLLQDAQQRAEDCAGDDVASNHAGRSERSHLR